ncbi:unnamed protein product [Mytilus edulis]|uniref:RRM domain-containing protein n=1 Tax=Mytilus edulis TaxID=6550 RepID=A0A8S3TZ93_MYTED|nr:unnamed protein product [Mytilus edulis]
MVTLDWSNEEELLKEEEEEEKKAEEAAKEDDKKDIKTEDEVKTEEKKDESMDTSENKDSEEKKDEWVKTLLTYVLRGPVKVTNLQIKDLSSRELQGVLHKSFNTQIDFQTKKGTIHLNFTPNKDRFAIDVLKRLARFQHANKEVKIQCSRSVAALLGFELRRLGVGPAPPGTLQFDKVLFLYDIPPETTEEVLRAMFDCPICIIPLDEEGNNMGAAFLEFRSKKAAKQCHTDNTDIEIGEKKCKLYNRYLVGGTKDEDDAYEKEEKEKQKKEQDRKAMAGQKKVQNQPRARGGTGKANNKRQAIKQKFNQARQMGQFGGRQGGGNYGGSGGNYGGGGGNYGASGGNYGGGGGMGGGRMSNMSQGDQGVSPNLMMNQMMAMMRMSQGMGGEGMGGGGSGMGRGMSRMGNQRAMSAGGGGMGGGRMAYDDYGDYGAFDDYESGYGQGRNMGGMGNMGGGGGGGMGGRRPQSLMGNNRRGSFGSGPNDQKDSVVDLFESALDAVDNQIGGRGNPRNLSGGRNGRNQGNAAALGKITSLMDNEMGMRGNSQSHTSLMDNEIGMRGNSQSHRGKFDTPANQRLAKLAGNYNEDDLHMEGGGDFGAGPNIHIGYGDETYNDGGSNRLTQRGGNDFGGSGSRDQFADRLGQGYEGMAGDRVDNYNQGSKRSMDAGYRQKMDSGMGGGQYDDYVRDTGDDYSRVDDFSPRRRDMVDTFQQRRTNVGSGYNDKSDMLSVDRNQPISYPDIYSSKGSSGMSEMFSPKKRKFTEEPMKRTYNDYLMDTTLQDSIRDDSVFKKPNMSLMVGRNQNQRTRGGQNNQRGRGGQNKQRGRHIEGFSFQTSKTIE